MALGVAAALLGACSDDDDEGGFPAAAAADEAEGDGAADEPGEGPCRLLTPADLQAATGVAFGAGEPVEATCTYVGSDGVATVGVHVTALTTAPALAVETTSATCAEGSVVELEVAGAEGAFGCTVAGVVVAAAASEDLYVVLTAASVDVPAGAEDLLGPLRGLLREALAAA